MSIRREDLSWTERMFLAWCCHEPPPQPFEPSAESHRIPAKPLDRLERVFGQTFRSAFAGRVVADIGCGPGAQLIAAVEAGAQRGVGVDRNESALQIGRRLAVERGVGDRIILTSEPIGAVGSNWADVVLCQNSFEHFSDPESVIREAYEALKPGGLFFLTYGPPWLHPYGAHHYFMIRRPWMHCIFSCRTILRVRQLYRPNTPMEWSDVSLNQMTIHKCRRILTASPFVLRQWLLTPITGLPHAVTRLPLLREFFTTHVSAVLQKQQRT